ncbi:MAG: molybdate ABC transporter permease subunit [Clostridiales bacterium]|nr:molybdate ABC transporter permease subunit [Clostridiales bacterium]
MNISPVLISIRTSIVSICITFVLGLMVAKAVAAIRRPWIKGLLDGLCTLPMVLPPTVAGFFLLYLFGVKRPIGQFLLDYFGVKIAFSWEATVLAAFVLSFPLMYRSARGALQQVDSSLLDAARTLGRSEMWVFFRVELPLALPGVMSGAVLAFARGLGEFGATAMIAGNIQGRTRTLPLAIYSAVAGGDLESAQDYVLILLGVSLLVVLGMGSLSGNRRSLRRRGEG